MNRTPEPAQPSRPPGFVLGIDIGGTKVALAAAALDGTRLGADRFATDADEGAERVVARVLEAARSLADQAEAGCVGGLRGVAVATPGVVREHGVLLAPNNPGWPTLPLPARVRSAFPAAPVAVLNDVRAAALAETRLGALRETGNGLYLNLGTGLSAATVIDGAVVGGAHGAAGEIAYQVASTGDPAFAAHRAPLEERVSGQGIADRAGRQVGRPISPAEAFALAGRADGSGTAPAAERIRALLDDAFEALAVHVANLAVALDPALVVLGGGLAAGWRGLDERLQAVLDRVVPFPPRVLRAALGDDSALEGALLVAADTARTEA